MVLHGRKTIYTSEKDINRDNILAVLSVALPLHTVNVEEINYLHDYRKGITPILKKTNEVRDDINYIISENHAEEIMTFWSGYSYGEPLQYVRRNTGSEDIDILNNCMYAESKASKDAIMGEWFFESGIGYLVVLPNEDETSESSFKIYAADPRKTFIIYKEDIEPIPVACVFITSNKESEPLYSVYTKNEYFEIEKEIITKAEPHIMKAIPCVEYSTRIKMGMFELVLPILDAINMLQSSRLDDIVQFVQSFMKLTGCTITEDKIKEFKKKKMIMLPEGADADMISSALDQTGVQTLKDDLYNAMLTICCMPNRNGGSSTSDTGVAVVYRDGWSAAETKAKIIDLFTDASEKKVIALCVYILNKMQKTNLKVSDIDIKHTRRNYEALMTKTQALTEMLKTDKIHPELAFTHCGLFTDPETAYRMSQEFYEKTMKQSLTKIMNEKGLDINDK